MAAVHEDRNAQLSPGVAIKAPCRAATTAAITLSGEQTVDGVALVSGDRCLVKDQSNSIDNGIYDVDTGTWERSPDFDGNRDVIHGTFVFITNGAANAGGFYECTTTADPIVFGTSNITFAAGALGPIVIPLTASNVNLAVAGPVAVAINLQNYIEDGVYNAMGFVAQNIKSAIRAGTNTVDTSTALQTMASAAAGSLCRIPQGTWIVAVQLEYTTTGAYVPALNLTGDGMGRTVIDNRVAGGACFLSKSSQSGNFQLGGGIANMFITTTTSPATSHGIEMIAAYNFLVHNVRFKGLSGDGYRITSTIGDPDAAILPVVNLCRFENCNIGLNCNFGSTITQPSFLAVYNSLFASCTVSGWRYIGAQGKSINNGFATNVGPGFWAVFNAANNPQFTSIGDSFENNGGVGVEQIRLDSMLSGVFKATEIASTVGNCTLGATLAATGGGSCFNTKFDSPYIRVGAGFNPYTAFTFGANSNLCKVLNTEWNTFDAAGQVRYSDGGTSNILSDSGSRLVLGNGASGANLTLANGANQNVVLPIEGTVFLVSGPTGAFNIGGFAYRGASDDNREFILMQQTGQIGTLNNEDAGSTATNRLRMDNGTSVTWNTSGAIRIGRINGRWQVLSKG